MSLARICILSLIFLAAPALAATSTDAVATDADKKKAKKKSAKKKEAKPKVKTKSAPKKAVRKKPKRKRALKKWAFGVRGGLNLTNAGGEDADEVDTDGGFNAAGILIYEVNKFVMAETGVGFTTRGYSIEKPFGDAGTPLTGAVSYSFGYLEVPVLLRLVLPNWQVKPFFHGGLTLGFLLTSEMEQTVEGPTGGTDIRQDEVPDAASFEFGVKVGAGVEFTIIDPSVGLIASFDFVRGLTDTTDESKRPAKSLDNVPFPAKDLDRVNSGFEISAGAIFRF